MERRARRANEEQARINAEETAEAGNEAVLTFRLTLNEGDATAARLGTIRC